MKDRLFHLVSVTSLSGPPRRVSGREPLAALGLASSILVVAIASASASAAGELQRLRSFGFADQRGQYPVTPLIFGSDGALYGTTAAGGSHDAGTVFKVQPDGSGYTVLHALGPGGDRGRPHAGVVEASDGVLYGTTASGGEEGVGTVFKLNKDGSGYAVLHNFSRMGSDGQWGAGELVEGGDGALYGTTYTGGGELNLGTAFRIGKDGSGYAILHRFEARVGGTDGGGPRAGLIKASDGVLYGTTAQGGRSGVGTVFKLNPDGSAYAVLYSFGDTPDDGYGPHARLEEGADGFLYGATPYGGAGPVGALGSGNGALFRISKDGTGYTILHRFTNTAGDGANPMGALLIAADGSLLGTAQGGGTNRLGTGAGIVFSLKPDGTDYRVLHTFGFPLEDDGGRPAAGLVQDGDGTIYGTTELSGNTAGTVFKLHADGSGYRNIVQFGLGSGDGIRPRGALLEGRDGVLYGTTTGGGSDVVGTLYRVNKDGSAYAILHEFPAFDGDGYRPDAGLIQGDDGVLYGTTPGGGENNLGTVFRINADGGGYTVLHHFTLTATNAFSYGAPVSLGFASGNHLYGTTRNLGAYGEGTVFRLNVDGSGFQTLHDFNASALDGFMPNSAIIEGSDGVLYGTTQSGGFVFGGTVFAINKDGTGYRIVYAFDAMQRPEDGARPQAGVIEASDGLLYGTTSSEGFARSGTLFKVNKDGSNFEVVRAFSPDEKSLFNHALVEGIEGVLYGVRDRGGSRHGGAVFRMNKDGTGYEILAEFGCDFPELTSPNGADPMAPLIVGSDGALFGTTMHGGDMPFPGFGTIFRLVTPEAPRLTALRISGGTVEVDLAGKPECTYELLRSTDLNTWSGLTTIKMPADGRARVVDAQSPGPAACYRARWFWMPAERQ